MRIEKPITERLGIHARVIGLTRAELAAAVRANPLGDVAVNPSSHLVAVLESPADRRVLEPLMKQDWSLEVLALGRRVASLWRPDGLLVRRPGAAIGKLLREYDFRGGKRGAVIPTPPGKQADAPSPQVMVPSPLAVL